MPRLPDGANGSITAGKTSIPVDVRCASKFSLWIRFLNGERYKDGMTFSNLTIPLNGKQAELGPFRLKSEPNIEGYAGRLIPLTDFYDLETLFSEHKIEKLQTAFVNLPLVLSHKENIRPSFKDYTANLTYDLNVYKTMFDKLESEYRDEPEDVREMAQQVILDTEGMKFKHFLDMKLQELQNLVKDFDKEEHERHGFYFRKQLWNIITCCPFMARTNLKPRGYSGDSVMMKMLYFNGYEGETTYYKLLNKHPLEAPAAQAVRNRRGLISRALFQFKTRYRPTPSRKMKVLSVACGPAFELKDILLTAQDCELYHFALLDQDREALLEAAVNVNQIEKSLDCKISVDYLNESVRTMLSTPQLKRKWGKFQFIYSMGLFDYLTPPVARAVLKKLYELLDVGGEMVIGNFHVSNPSRYYMEYWLDWVLYYRTDEEFLELLEGDSSAEVEVSFEDTGVQMFLRIRKRDHGSVKSDPN